MFFYCSELNYICNENNSLLVPSVEDCIQFQDNMCNDGDKAEDTFFMNNCNTYYMLNQSTPVCPNQFGLFCDTFCLPLCHEFSQNGNSVTLAINNTIKIVFFVANFIGWFVIVASFLMRRSTKA